ncbi:MAG: F0F1 ATP synthase subunit B, partial [Propionibacteriaceae bacterium]|nr:F0F1 ATP synthase subunit B [Propionibacteriaceae bacterium]
MVPNVGVPLNIDLGPLLPHYLSEVIVGIILMLLIFLVMWKVVVPRFE